ncbi:MAG TPA: methyl-accepting chemotaxis protein, partial [Clostridiales bacterium]|nr:methyl-accepting chemotaxis protein [Clostridiales bacterium]
MKNFKIRTRMIIGFAVVIIISVIAIFIGIQGLLTVNDSYNFSYTDSVDALKSAEGISSGFWKMYTHVYAVLVSSTQEDKDFNLEEIKIARADIIENIKLYREIFTHYDESEIEQEKALLDLVEDSFTSFDAAVTEVLESSNAQKGININKIKESVNIGSEIDQIGREMETRINDLVEYNNQYAREQISANGKVADQVVLIVSIGAVVALVVGIFVSWSISKNMSRRLKNLAKDANEVASGDVDISFNVKYNDEIGDVRIAFRKMVEAIRQQAHIVQQIADRNIDVDVEIRSEKDILGKKLSELV